MTNPMEPAFGYEKARLNQTCDYYGATFEVIVPGQKGHEEPEEYFCPECHKEFKCIASNSPNVIPRSPRTDGRTGPFSK